MDFANYQSPKLLGSSPPITNKHGVSQKHEWWLSQIWDRPLVNIRYIGKIWDGWQRESGIFQTHENQAWEYSYSSSQVHCRVTNSIKFTGYPLKHLGWERYCESSVLPKSTTQWMLSTHPKVSKILKMGHGTEISGQVSRESRKCWIFSKQVDLSTEILEIFQEESQKDWKFLVRNFWKFQYNTKGNFWKFKFTRFSHQIEVITVSSQAFNTNYSIWIWHTSHEATAPPRYY